ncbi:folate-sensitive fragile site protein Fra10Ac1-domain-containing protein [Syncephalastrum racemosum]|uniref:Folate-sensitive fragile site protein Fra10Ac1-domain-containing protein n=1 Tax=Syncephalastrum racemosum TaxID=13706 RepID=A0A1X2HHM2_SYNRA|nr:folate-sensitive fragile site protein Fra10Ac1-domain-containing protein [Syncephalastrum racemosum]
MTSDKFKLAPAFRNQLNGVDAYTRHRKLIQNYVLFYGRGNLPHDDRTKLHNPEHEIIRKHHRFLPPENGDDLDWEQRLAKKYHDQLFKEYAICELKYYKEGKIALRWRTESEVVSGKGQFACGSTRCDNTASLKSWEVNFAYVEDGVRKNELVKVRLCPDCSYRLNYKTMKRASKKRKREELKATVRRERDHHRSDTEEERESKSEERSSDEGDAPERKKSKQKEKGKDDASNIWKQPMETKVEKTHEEEFSDYFADLLM